jgi:hypothetical protein
MTRGACVPSSQRKRRLLTSSRGASIRHSPRRAAKDRPSEVRGVRVRRLRPGESPGSGCRSEQTPARAPAAVWKRVVGATAPPFRRRSRAPLYICAAPLPRRRISSGTETGRSLTGIPALAPSRATFNKTGMRAVKTTNRPPAPNISLEQRDRSFGIAHSQLISAKWAVKDSTIPAQQCRDGRQSRTHQSHTGKSSSPTADPGNCRCAAGRHDQGYQYDGRFNPRIRPIPKDLSAAPSFEYDTGAGRTPQAPA